MNEGESRPAAESARLRALALGWLQDEVRLQRDLVENGEWDAERLRRSLAELVADPAFASVRDQPGVSAIGAEEARGWSALWAGSVDRRPDSLWLLLPSQGASGFRVGWKASPRTSRGSFGRTTWFARRVGRSAWMSVMVPTGAARSSPPCERSPGRL